MKILIQVGQLLLSLSILIILHELGHFLFARLFKTRVEKFYLFFDPWFSLFKVKKGETEYGIGWLPLGGYVKISGMIDESMDKEAMKQPPQPYEFRTKPAWQRLLIMLGGVMVNLILGFLIFASILFIWGETYLPNKNLKDGIWVTDSIMLQTGLNTGDKIISVNGKEPDNYRGVIEEMLYGGSMLIERNGKDTTLMLANDFAGKLSDYRIHNEGPLFLARVPFIISEVPDTSLNIGIFKSKDQVIEIDGVHIKYFDQVESILDTLSGKTIPVVVLRDNEQIGVIATVSGRGKIEVGVGWLSLEQLEKLGVYELARKKYTFLQSIPAGFLRAKEELYSYIRQFKLILNPETGAYKAVGGFGAITNLFPPQWDWEVFWHITAFLSIMLAFLNILPIPALDGGHVTFLIYEMVTGRKPGDKFLEYAQIVGMVLLLFLLLYANGNDVYRWILRLIGK
jgi:regulator of sigma E protease